MSRLQADWLEAAPTRAVLEALTARGNQLLFVGGCVRNALLGHPVSDLDLSTDAWPEQVTEMAETAGLRVVPTGIDHGTVTVISEGHPFEITTFRRDVETDGRRATIAFATDVAEDAARRDFTMNALYADGAGQILDPIGGLPDLEARRVRFIGNAVERIREDYLRILRFFRFHAHYGDPHAGLDPAGLSAIIAHQEGIDALSRERVGAEIAKLLAAPDPAPSVAAMQETGALTKVLPGADAGLLPDLTAIERETETSPNWIRRLVALGHHDWSGALRMSRRDARAAEALAAILDADLPLPEAAYRDGPSLAVDAALLRAAAGTSLPETWREQIAEASAAAFPLQARDLTDRYDPGPALGAALKTLEARWIASGFGLTRDDLLAIDSAGRL